MSKIKGYLEITFYIALHLFFLEKILQADVAIPISQPLTADAKTSYQGLLNNIVSSPAIVIDDATNQLIQIPVNRISRYMLPSNVQLSAQKSNLSVLRLADQSSYKNYPSGGALFPKNSNIAEQFNAVFSEIKANQELVKFFRKIHFNCLNQMYAYFMKIYTNLLLRHVGSSYDSSGKVIVDLDTCIADEQIYATNQKILIMSYLVNLIESQFHAMVLMCVPTTTYIFATPIGKTLIQNDFAIDFSVFATSQSDQGYQQMQSSYLNFLKKYITLFQLYASLTEQPDPATGFSQYISVAQTMQANSSFINMNPAMFFYDNESIKAIKMIPYLAAQLPVKTSSIGWSQDVVDAATKGVIKNNHQVAYFKDASNTMTKDKSQAAHLCILSSSGVNLFEEELLVQPDWLNTSQGVLSMLQASLGDFSKIVDLNILDPFTQAILEKTIHGSVNVQTAQTVNDLLQAIVPTDSFVQNPADPVVTPTPAVTSTSSQDLAAKQAADKAAADAQAKKEQADQQAASAKAAQDLAAKQAADKAAADAQAQKEQADQQAASAKAAQDLAAKQAADKAAADAQAQKEQAAQQAAIIANQQAAAKAAQQAAAAKAGKK